MTDITREGDIKLAVLSTDVEGRQKCKIQSEQLTWKKILKKRKKREKRTRKCGRKKKKKWKKTKSDGQYEHFSFFFQWLLSLGLTHIFCCIILLKLYCWRFCCSVRH